MKQFYIYIKCKPDGTPFYVGKGCGKRYGQMVSGRNKKFIHIVAKYGKSNILTYIFLEESERDALDNEVIAIKSLRDAGYDLANMTDGGEGTSGFHAPKSDEHKRKIGDAHKGKKLSKEQIAVMSANGKKQYANGCGIAKINNKPRTEEHCRRISQSRMGNTFSLGHRHSAESKMKMSIAKKGKKTTRPGYTHSEETRRKIAESHARRRQPNITEITNV